MSESNLVNSHIVYWDLYREEDRLKTFSSWTNNDVDKIKLAKFGFYYNGPKDTVKCVYCDVPISKWKIGDDPLMEHIFWSPSCPFLLHSRPINKAIDSNFETQLPSPEYFVPIVYNDNESINEQNRATHKIILSGRCATRHPAYSSHEERLKSFDIWPKSLKPRPQALSEAGFFYLGVGDQVKCFYCGGGLRNWTENDEPWNEHAKLVGPCEFLTEWRDEQFIEQARSAHKAINNNVFNNNNTSHDEIIEKTVNSFEKELNSAHSKKCNICLKEELNTMFCPCNHIYACENCAALKTHCPICHKKIIEIKKCYLS